MDNIKQLGSMKKIPDYLLGELGKFLPEYVIVGFTGGEEFYYGANCESYGNAFQLLILGGSMVYKNQFEEK